MTTWAQPPSPCALRAGEIHIWRSSLVQTADAIQAFHETLSEDEQDRAARFHFIQGRRQYIVSRGLLRRILGQYLDVAPAVIRFDYTAHGKPLLDFPRATDVQFNVAHSGEQVLLAFTLGAAVGVDIEKARPDFAGQRIADRFFSPRESARLRALPREQQEQAFLNGWTRKEAYIKAHGEGLSCPLDSFDVSLGPDEPVALLHVAGDADEAGRWSMYGIEVGDGYAAAVAVARPRVELRYWVGE